MLLEDDFLDFLRCLNETNAKYILIGGYASIIHGVNRTTGDMDIFVERTKENADKVILAIENFGMGGLGIEAEDMLEKDNVIQLGVSPIRIDILNDIPAISFEETYNMAFDYQEGDVVFKVIHINHLIENKEHVGRGKDLEDVKILKRILNKKK